MPGFHSSTLLTCLGPAVHSVYDNCPGATAWHEASGRSARWLGSFLRKNAPHNASAIAYLAAMGGG